MSKYHKYMVAAEISKPELFNAVKKADTRITMREVENYINDISLPTPQQLDTICGALDCHMVELYNRNELDLLRPDFPTRVSRGGKSHRNGTVYNLTVEIPRETAEYVLTDAALKKLGYKDKTDFIRHAVRHLAERYSYLLAKEKAALDTDTSKATKPLSPNECT